MDNRELFRESHSGAFDAEEQIVKDEGGNDTTPRRKNEPAFLPTYFTGSFENMNRMRRDEKLCDITIVVGSTRIPAHRIVLASASAYFEAMFTAGMVESRENTIELHDIDATSVESIIDFIYTSQIEISEDNVQTLLPASTIIQVEPVKEACCKFLSAQLSPCNCLGILVFADMHGCVDLLSIAKSYALVNFVEISRTEEFLHITPKRLIELISDDNLYSHDESQVYLAVMSWIRFDLANRQQNLTDLLTLVKLPLLSRDFLMFSVEPDELVRSNPNCKDLIIDAMKYHLLPEMRPYLHNSRVKPRKNAGMSPLILSIGGGSLFAIHCECECFDAAKNKWFMIAPMSSRRARLGVGSAFGMVYAVGGFDGSQDLASVEMYNPKSNKWVSSAPMGTRRSSLGVDVLHNLLYAVGGYDGASCLCSVERFDPLLQQWTSVAPMAFRRRYVAVRVVGEYLIASGGYDGNSHLSSVELYDPITNVWTLKSPMRNQRSNASSAVLNGYFYVIGRLLNYPSQHKSAKQENYTCPFKGNIETKIDKTPKNNSNKVITATASTTS
ncbi:kelch-like protein 17 isoform X2 [Rhopilema esculentum]|uniref:kelch-like protein 17 isoform X2 n=1 Tax=Rhopilema esculentum TaxID=499914 RepID=UPI0031CE6DB9